MGLQERILDGVNLRAASLAESEHETRYAPKPRHQALLRRYFDQGVLRIAKSTGIIRDEVGTLDPQDNMDPPTGPPDELVPMEMEVALEYLILSEWFASIGVVKLAEFYQGKYDSEFQMFRFGVGRMGKASVPRRV